MTLLGPSRLRDWATLMLVSDLDDGDEEQLSTVVTRARMCQNLARRMAVPADAAFTVGLVSAVAGMLGQQPRDLAPRLDEHMFTFVPPPSSQKIAFEVFDGKAGPR